MNRTKILSICALMTTSLIVLSISHRVQTKNKINNALTEYIDFNEILTTQTSPTNPNSKILIPKQSTDENSDISLASPASFTENDSYTISIDNIIHGKIAKEKIDDSIYYNYSFNADLILHRNGNEFKTNIQSKVVLEKENFGFKIKSVDDLKQDLLKKVVAFKNYNSEDISKELTELSLIYQSKELDIQLSYPEYYSYSNNPIVENGSMKDTISFYMDDDKTNNYVVVSLDNKSNFNPELTINKLIKQNYSLISDKFETPYGIDFTVLSQNFTQDSKEITEQVYISNSPYNSIGKIIVTAKMESSILKNKINEIEEIIKSIK